VICGTRIFSFKKSYSLPREETGEKHKDNSLRKGAKNGDANEVTARIKANAGGGMDSNLQVNSICLIPYLSEGPTKDRDDRWCPETPGCSILMTNEGII
jgi:hypothetical protein